MALNIKYLDVPSLHIYAIIFSENMTDVYDPGGGFVTYNESNFADYAVLLPERVGNSGLYTTGLYHSDFALYGEFDVLIYQKIGTSYDKNTDALKAQNTIIWDGAREIIKAKPRLEGGGYLGTYTPGQGVISSLKTFNSYNVPYVTEKSQIDYRLIDPSGQVISTGYIPHLTVNSGILYSGTINTSGLNTPGTYMIQHSGVMESIFLQHNSYFTISTGVGITANVLFDIHEELAYATGLCNQSTTNGYSFTTTLPSTDDDFYNGQVIRNRDLPGQGRIISDYVGSTRTVYVNKPVTISSGHRIIIYPIGGELGVS